MRARPPGRLSGGGTGRAAPGQDAIPHDAILPDAILPDAILPDAIPAIAADGSLYPIDKMAAHRLGQKHLAVSVFVFCGERLLIQKRAAGKYHCGGLWANTCCTHPFWGEAPADTATRRLRQELGLALPLDARAVVEYRADVTDGLIEDERVHVFEGVMREPVDVASFDPAEVEAVRWITLADLAAEIEADAQAFTPWLRIYMQRWPELLIQNAA
jgi:isopentenyl-diphosphate Delta-isomerase